MPIRRRGQSTPMLPMWPRSVIDSCELQWRQMLIIASKITGNSIVCSTVCSRTKKTSKCPLSSLPPLWCESRSYRWTPLTNDQQCGKRLHIMTSFCSPGLRVQHFMSFSVFHSENIARNYEMFLDESLAVVHHSNLTPSGLRIWLGCLISHLYVYTNAGPYFY